MGGTTYDLAKKAKKLRAYERIRTKGASLAPHLGSATGYSLCFKIVFILDPLIVNGQSKLLVVNTLGSSG